jgi:hypothetical protein
VLLKFDADTRRRYLAFVRRIEPVAARFHHRRTKLLHTGFSEKDKQRDKRAFRTEDHMPTNTQTLVCSFRANILRLTLLISIAAAALLTAANGTMSQDSEHAHGDAPAKLVQTVRDATKQFVNVNAATAAGYQPFLGCVSGPDHGAMGYHYVNSALIGDGLLDASRPEALIYEASGKGLQLVGVEFVAIADTWLANHTSPPVLEGQSFQFVGSPNRYGLPAHFELHVWAWRDNPNGAFVDWNNKVSCEGK